MTADPAVRATSLTRTFATRLAVSDLTLSLHAGEIVALLGPNGAGKTTTLRMLAGLIPPSAGEITVKGHALTMRSADELRRHVGLLTESPGLWDRLSVRINLMTYARLHSLPHPAEAVRSILAVVGLADRERDAAGALSKGLRQRLAIARALLHEPSILLLDEPTSGLDPASARHMRDLIGDLRKQGRAILVSTHNLSEAETLADRIAVLNTRLLAIGAPMALRRQFSGTRVEIEVEGPADAWVAALRAHSTTSIETAGPVLAVTLVDEASTPDLVAALVTAGARIRRVAPGQRTLEEVYLSLVGDQGHAA